MVSTVLGVLILTSNGDRTEFLQDPYSYAPSFTESTPLGSVQSFQLGSYLKSTYLDSSSPHHILNMPLDPSHPIPPNQVNVHAKPDGEGAAIFDSTIALLQGMFPPTSHNKIELANGSTIVAPLGGYQYVPVETEVVDHVLQPWTDCKAFKKHVSDVYASQEFANAAKEAQHFFASIQDYMFGRPTTLVDMWNVYDYLNTQLTYNQTFAFRLPPTYVEQARGLADYKETLVFTDEELGGIGNIAGRTILSPILKALERIAFDDDPLRILLIGSSYQPFISLFHMLNAEGPHGPVWGIPNFASALSFELIRGPGPEFRDFVRVKFKNGTEDEEFQTLHIFEHPQEAMAVTEFIYRLEHHVVHEDKWSSACSTSWFPFGIGASTATEDGAWTLFGLVSVVSLFSFCLFAFAAYRKYVKQTKRATRQYEAVAENECRGVFVNDKSPLLP